MSLNRSCDIEVVKQYAGQEQVDLSVEIEVPGTWFGGTLSAAERREKYKAQAVEYAIVREFPGPDVRSRKTKDDWLHPTLQEIVTAYMKLYGKESRESDNESSRTEGFEGTEEENEEENGEGDAEEGAEKE